MEITAYFDNELFNARTYDDGPSLSQILVDAVSTATELHGTDTIDQSSGILLGNFTYNGPKVDLTTVTGIFTTLKHYTNGLLMETDYSAQPIDLIKFIQDNGSYMWSFLAGNDVFTGSLTNKAQDTVIGLGGNDTFEGGGDNGDADGNGAAGSTTYYNGRQDWFDGGEGIDTAIFRGNIGNYTTDKKSDIFDATTINLAASSYLSGFRVHDTTGLDGTDFLINVERLKFSDTKLALDLDGNAGLTAKILGSVFGAASVSNKQFVGIGLSILDGGMSYSDLMALALNAAGATTNDAVVTVLWTNVVGTAPTAADKAPFIDMLNNGMKAGDLGVLAADTTLNTAHINLVGLVQTGIEYI